MHHLRFSLNPRPLSHGTTERRRARLPAVVLAALTAWSLAASLALPVAYAQDATPDPSLAAFAEHVRKVSEAASEAFDAGRFGEAIEGYSEAYALHNNPQSLWNIARSYEELGELALARSSFLRVVSFAYVQEMPAPVMAQLAQDKKDAQVHVEKLNGLIERQHGLFSQGEQALRTGNYEAARVSFAHALEVGATPAGQLGLATSLYKLGRLDDARFHVHALLKAAGVSSELKLAGDRLLEDIEESSTRPAATVATPPPQVQPDPPVRDDSLRAPDRTADELQSFEVGVGTVFGWTLVGLGGAMAVGAAGLRLSYEDEAAYFESLPNGHPDIDGLKDDLIPKEQAFGGLLAAGVGSTLVGVLVLALSGGDAEAGAHAGSVTRWGLGLGTVGVAGAF